MEEVLESGAIKVAPATEEALESEAATLLEESLESMVVMESELAPNSIEALDAETASYSVEASLVVPESIDMVADSIEMVPDSVTSLCARCGTFHDDDDGEACYQARRQARRCARCGLLHEDYDLSAQMLYDMEKYDCEVYIPDVDKLEMDDNTIILPEHVTKKLDEHIEEMKQGAMEDARKNSTVKQGGMED